MSYWRQATLDKLCSGNINSRSQGAKEQSRVDYLFTFLEGRKPSKMISRPFSSTESETLLRCFANFGAIATNTVDSFKCILQDLRKDERFIVKTNLRPRIKDTLHKQSGAKSYDRFGRGGVVLRESAMRLKVLFLKAAVPLPSECLDLFQTIKNFPPEVMQSKLTVEEGGSQEEKLNDQNELFIYVVQMPSNRNV